MRKSINSHKVALVVWLLTFWGITNLSAQGIRTSYFMDNVPARLKLNPALQPARGYFSIPGVGAIGITASSNKLSIDDFVDIIENENDFLNSDGFIRRLDNKNTMNIDLTLDAISFGFYSGKAFWTVNVGTRAIVSASIPKTMFEFSKATNDLNSLNTSNMAEVNELLRTYDIRKMELYADVFTEIGVGYSRPVTRNLTVGGRLKALIGMGNLNVNIDEIYVDANMHSQTWKVRTNARLEANMKGLELGYSEDGYIDNIDFDSPGVSGYGVGLDFGVNYNLFDRVNLSAAMIDLGFISWSKSSSTVAASASEHTYGYINIDPDYNGDIELEAADVFDLDLIQFTEEESESRTTSLRSTLNIGAEWLLANNKLGIGILSSTQFTKPQAYSELTVSANYRPKNWFGATLSYSVLHSDFETVGIGLKLGPVFIGSDYLMTKAPGKSNRTNAYVGISFGLGKKRADY